jgi:lipid A 3-O-deacylase
VNRGWAIVACALATAAFADEDPARWYFRMDNDFFFHTDRWYTSGLRLARVKDGIEWGIVQEIYTPEAKYLSPTLQDRAPAGRLYASVSQHVQHENTFDSFEIDAGVRGPSALGEQFQNAAHDIVTSGVKVDWSRQLPDAFDGSVIVVRTQTFGGGLRGHVGGVVGSQVSFAHLGVEWRIGNADAPSSPMMRFAATPPFNGNLTGFSGYIGASVRGVARNELLSKNYYTFGPDLEKKREVTRVAGGLSWAESWGSVALDLVEDSREFEGQRKNQAFGSLALHVNF